METNSIFKDNQIANEEMIELLNKRAKGEINFKLIDTREIYEYSDESIDGTDLLYPTTLFHKYIDELNESRDENIILCCQTGNRTEQILEILKRMGFEKVAHLARGIINFSGKTSKNAELPQNIK
ncbi:MAG: rhodanese-like domain-containing protein [Epsilonproteobacteria bacterium]|nr:rhodanese-like domain-containing protein [Campylobacterota bacterium]